MNLSIEKLGSKMRTLRKSRVQTLEDLSLSTGLSKGMLSQIERGLSQPSLETLWKISRALDTSISHFFEDATVNKMNIVRQDNRRQIVFPNANGICYLVGQSNSSRLKTFEIILKPKEFFQPSTFQ